MSGRSVYLLVHPEQFPSVTDGDERTFETLPEDCSLADFDRWHNDGIAERAAACDERVCLLDSYGREYAEDEGEIADGLSAEGWTCLDCEPVQVGRIVRAYFAKGEPGRVTVAGFARRDCVARAASALAKLGYEVTLDERATLPLSAEGAAAYLAR